MNEDLLQYYAQRAREYEKIYFKPERQEDLKKLEVFLKDEFAGLNVYEAACGTGYWTRFISLSAKSVYACDINEEVLEIARSKKISSSLASFNKEDIFKPYDVPKFNSLFGGFIWSHILLNQVNEFLDSIESRIHNGGKIIFADNNYIEGSSTSIDRIDENGNSYQLRKLDDGTEHLVLKNFPREDFLRNIFKERGKFIEFITYEYFWVVKYTK